MLHQARRFRPRPYTPVTSHPGLAAAKHGTGMLRQGAGGEAISLLQQALIGLGFPLPNSTAGGTHVSDGVFGPETLAAVWAFQNALGLEPDGIVGPKTIAALADATERTHVSALLTGAEIILQIGEGAQTGHDRNALKRAIKPFDAKLWRHPDVPAYCFNNHAAFAGGSKKSFFPVIFAPVAAEAAAAALIFGAALIVVAVEGPPSIPKPQIEPAISLADIVITAVADQVVADGLEKLRIVEAWVDFVHDQNDPDPRCQEAVEHAKRVIEELRLAAESAANIKHYVGWRGLDLPAILTNLAKKMLAASWAVSQVTQHCRWLPPG